MKPFVVICKNITERSIAMHSCSRILNIKISEETITDEWSERDFERYPSIRVGNALISAYDSNQGCAGNGIVKFTELADFLSSLKKQIEIKLNDEYTAVVSKNFVQVGCQTFSWEKIEEVYKAIQKIKKG